MLPGPHIASLSKNLGMLRHPYHLVGCVNALCSG